MISIDTLNTAPAERFVAELSGIFEHSPWVAERALPARPFRSRLALLDAMRAVVASATVDEQLTLIRAHPELAGRAAIRDELTPNSSREQQGAGLHACTREEFARLQELNAAYVRRFGFPFILAVRGHNPASILREFEKRLTHDVGSEHAVALEQIGRIAGFRLADSVISSPGPETMAMIDRLAQFSEQDGALTCSYLSLPHQRVASLLRDWMLAAGLDATLDSVGNVVGRMSCARSDARTLMTGSHYDTVINAGRYDGRLGIIIPILVATQLRQRGEQLPFDLEIVAFADEEGVRFKSTFLGSSAIAGSFETSLFEALDDRGVTMRDALRAAGLDPEHVTQLGRDPNRLLGFVEIHIEQGPVLLNENRPLGVVTSIAGSVRHAISIVGLAGHAGTVPMTLRRDAAAAAAEVVLEVEKRCSGVDGLVGTVGRLEVPQGAINVIPGRCELTLDIRAADDATRDAALTAVLRSLEHIAAKRNVDIDARLLMQAAAVPCSSAFQQRWAQSITRITGDPTPRLLQSGAGHDAMKLAAITDVGMLFVRCGNGGISHHPDESMECEDAELAARAFHDLLLNFRIDV
jgi:beta-ureidopropionase / N-carbamoyl-L-amino-acid hydrolase